MALGLARSLMRIRTEREAQSRTNRDKTEGTAIEPSTGNIASHKKAAAAESLADWRPAICHRHRE